MSNILVTVNEQKLHITQAPTIAAQGVNEDYVVFTLDSYWSGFGIIAFFYRKDDPDNIYQAAVNSSTGKALIPHEVTASNGVICFGIYGVKNSTIIYTSEVQRYRIVEGRYVPNSTPSEPITPGVYEQLVSMVGSLEQEMAEFISTYSGYGHETTLWTGTKGANGDTFSLSDNASNYDYIDVFYTFSGIEDVKTFLASNFAQGAYIRSTNLSDDSTGTSPLMAAELKITPTTSGNDKNYTINSKRWTWSGEASAAGSQVNPDSTNYQAGYIFKIVGRKRESDSEIQNARIGYDGTTYQTAGAAIRTQVSELHSGKQDVLTFDTTPTEDSTNPITSGAVYEIAEEVTSLNGDLTELQTTVGQISEDVASSSETVEVVVPLNLTDVRVGKRCTDSVGDSMTLSNSTVTTCVVKAFVCEANKTYKLTITNGTTPAQIGDRGTVVVGTGDQNLTVAWSKRATNTSNTQDIVEFTPTTSGYVFFNLDKNFQSIVVTTEETIVVTVKTAKDTVARNDISDLETLVGGLDEEIDALDETVSGYSTEIEKISEITELYDDGTTTENSVVIDTTYFHANKRSADTIGQHVSLTESTRIGFSSSTVTSCVARCFWCVADRTYRLTITNGQTPALVGDRATVVVLTPVEGQNYGDVAFVQRSTNSNNPTDVIEFTPTVSGYVCFNVDANYQSVSVKEYVPNEIATAIDYQARNDIETLSGRGGQIVKEITWESGSFDASLADVSGNGYRSNLITGVKGQAVCIKVDPTYTFTYGDGLNSLITIHGIYVIHPKTDTIRIGISDTAQNTGVEIRIYKERGRKGKYDVIVAASDSADEDKANADIVCDGTNDEMDIQFAVNWNFDRKQRVTYNDMCNVLLLPGTYNIDKFTQHYTAYGQLTREKYGVMFGNDTYGHRDYIYRVSIEGCYEAEHKRYNCSTLINVTNTGVATLGSETLNAVFGIALLAEGTTGAIRMNNMSIAVKNLGFFLNGITNKMICIDAYQAGNVVIKNCDMWTTNDGYQRASVIATAPEGSIGIRAGRGSCLGVRQRIEGNRIQGFHDGISLCGEHFIIQDNLEVSCVYGFSTNQYEVGGAVQHPNIFIGNSVEQCLKMGRLGESGMKDTIIYIGGSVENTCTTGGENVAMLPIEISATTRNRGRIESDSLASPYNNSFFYDGYGSTFVQTVYPYDQA